MSDRETAIDLLKSWGVVRRRQNDQAEFILSSGGQSDIYIDLKSALTDGGRVDSLARMMRSAIYGSKLRQKFDIVHGVGYGGIPLATALSTQLNSPYNGLSYSRSAAKRHGNRGRTELHDLMQGAPVEGKRVIVVDDVLTTGQSIISEIDAIGWLGGNVVGAVVAVDRSDGSAAEELARLKRPVQIISLLKLEDLL